MMTPTPNQKLSEWDDVIVGIGLALLILLICVGGDILDKIFLISW
jgi:hypothetical protein